MMMFLSSVSMLLLCVVALLAFAIGEVHTGAFDPTASWKPTQLVIGTEHHKAHMNRVISFHVAMEYINKKDMEDEFLAVSTPSHPAYGKHLNAQEIRNKYLSEVGIEKVTKFFNGIPSSRIEVNEIGSMIKVTAKIMDIEGHLDTTILPHYPKDADGLSSVDPKKTKAILKASSSLKIPKEITAHIAFVSLNTPVSPVSFNKGRKMKTLSARQQGKGAATFTSADKDAGRIFDAALSSSPQRNISVTALNTQAIIGFQPYCNTSDTGNTTGPYLNNEFVPCNNEEQYTVYVEAYTENITAADEINTDPYRFVPQMSKVRCYNTSSDLPCDGTGSAEYCYCFTTISPLPKYQQLRVITYSHLPQQMHTDLFLVGSSHLFVCTDTATASFLSDLYNIPRGLTVRYGSNQSVAEFYGEFYSNEDLAKFLQYSGLAIADIPNATNVYGDLANDQNSPGGEAQLDVEYIMALAPGADTFFYSFGDLVSDPSPWDGPINNEGFLSYLYVVGNQTNPPLVHSLSYGDIEANVFNASTPGAVEYGMRCDQEFLNMGLRGLSVIFSSGDDGIGDSQTREYPGTTYPGGCSQAWPSWPAASPYVTAVGGTQLTDKYLPICLDKYNYDPWLPYDDKGDVTCTGVAETTCSSSIGGVITSGGGFSNVSPRQPWQEDAVKNYLNISGNPLPPSGYFNASGRAYPDVATYASNYFIYLSPMGVIRESGTSASAPVFAAMVKNIYTYK